jgi:hypothetical protein
MVALKIDEKSRVDGEETRQWLYLTYWDRVQD